MCENLEREAKKVELRALTPAFNMKDCILNCLDPSREEHPLLNNFAWIGKSQEERAGRIEIK